MINSCDSEYNASPACVSGNRETNIVVYQDGGTGLSVDNLQLVLQHIASAKTFLLVPVENEIQDEEYMTVANHYLTHPEEAQTIRNMHPTQDAIAVRWIPFARENAKSGYLENADVSHLRVPEALRTLLHSRLARKAGLSDESVFVSEQIVTGCDLFTDKAVKRDMTERATEKLLRGTSFKKSLYDEQAIRNDRMFIQLYYIPVAIRFKLDASQNARQFNEYVDGCFSGIIDRKAKELFKDIADDALPYFTDALRWENAVNDFGEHVAAAKRLLEKAQQRERRKEVRRKIVGFFGNQTPNHVKNGTDD